MNVRLVNGTAAPRVRNSEGCTVADCGCAHDATRWLQLCEAHFTDWQDRHEAARVAHLAVLPKLERIP